MRSVTFTKEVEIDVDIYDIWDQMSDKDKEEFCKREGLTKLSSKNVDVWQDFVYALSDEEAQGIMAWIKFYGKDRIANVTH